MLKRMGKMIDRVKTGRPSVHIKKRKAAQGGGRRR